MKKKIIAGVIALLLVILAIILFTGGEKPDDSLFYIQNGELCYRVGVKEGRKITSLLAGNTEDGSLTEALTSRILFSADKKYVYFTDNADSSADAVTYYVTDLSDKNENKVKIDTRISRLLPAAKGDSVLYLKDGALYSYVPGGVSKLIAEEVTDFSAGKAQKAVAYVHGDNFILSVKVGSKAPSELDTGISQLGHADDKGNVFYTKNKVLYKTKAVKNKQPAKTKLFTTGLDEAFVGGFYAESSFYFLSLESTPLNVSDYVTDKELENDSKITTVLDRPKEPSRSEFSTDEEYGKAYSLYEKDLDAYYKSYNDFTAKASRDAIRKELSSTGARLDAYALCYFDGKKTKKVSENVDLENLLISESTPKGAVAVFDAPADAAKCCDVSECENYSALLAKVSEFISVSTEKKLCTFTSASTKSAKTDRISSLAAFSNDESAVYATAPENTLLFVKISSARVKTVSETFETAEIIEASNGTPLLYTGISGGSATLSLGKKQLGENVLVNSAVSENGKVYYLTDWSPEAKSGTLTCFAKGKSTIVSYDVSSFTVTEAGNCAFVKDSVLYSYLGRIYTLGENVSIALPYSF